MQLSKVISQENSFAQDFQSPSEKQSQQYVWSPLLPDTLHNSSLMSLTVKKIKKNQISQKKLHLQLELKREFSEDKYKKLF